MREELKIRRDYDETGNSESVGKLRKHIEFLGNKKMKLYDRIIMIQEQLDTIINDWISRGIRIQTCKKYLSEIGTRLREIEENFLSGKWAHDMVSGEKKINDNRKKIEKNNQLIGELAERNKENFVEEVEEYENMLQEKKEDEDGLAKLEKEREQLIKEKAKKEIESNKILEEYKAIDAEFNECLEELADINKENQVECVYWIQFEETGLIKEIYFPSKSGNCNKHDDRL